ncbi:MAG TPA: TIM barrel protein [Candidatus Saccharimonadales bacterium]|nr:TIM barrel protein [Candidatus Saccharimonadales bacterium]
MPVFAANLSMLWQELGPYDRFAAASAAGFRHVEMLFPHELDADRLEGTLNRFDLEMVSFDPAPGNWSQGERGLLTLPGREMEFLHGVREAIKLARLLGTTRLNTLVGIPPPTVSRADARETAVANLKMAAPLARAAGVTLLVEGINNIDIPGYWAGTVAAAVELVEAVDDPNVRLQLDQYHAGMAGEDAIECLHAHLPLVAHVQIADVPGRHEPGTGSQPIEEFLDDLDRVGYEGYVGLEYRPLADTPSSLQWLRAYRAERG